MDGCAELTLDKPIVEVRSVIWRCKLLKSTVLWSHWVSCLALLAAKYNAAGEPCLHPTPLSKSLHHAGVVDLQYRFQEAGCADRSVVVAHRSLSEIIRSGVIWVV